MSQATPSMVTVRYWAAARDAAGCEQELRAAGTAGEVFAAACAEHPELTRVLAVATVLMDGRRVTASHRVPPGATLEVLPPFAGG